MADPTRRTAPDAPADRPVDRLLAGYLLLVALPLLLPNRPGAWPLLLIAHLTLAGLLLTGAPGRLRGFASRSHSRAVRRGLAAVADWYPLLLMPFLYVELPYLMQGVWDGRYFDGVVMGWEQVLFGQQPSTTLARYWDSLPVSEVLHLAYLSYYPVIYFLPAVLYLRGQGEAFRQTVFAIMLGFTVSYVLFIAFPVQGPRYLFPAPDGELAEGPLYRLTHTVLEGGSSRGAAFPSAHAAIAAIQMISAGRHFPPAAPVLALALVGICVGAVYGGFHYGVDMAVGTALGLVVGWGAPAVRRALT